ncbi:MAG: hypothetical protein L0Y58_02175 [Verrucomicrobia subdivision 3 bacterium]|nr:hypothetical protein [Limisphaerales bacterium]
MNADEARRILLLCRPGSGDSDDPDIAEALQLAQRDPELRQWLDRHMAFQSAMRTRFAELPVPSDLKAAILERKIAWLPRWWQHPAWLAAAAVIAVLVGIAALWLQPSPTERFAFYRAHIATTGLREYRMDIKTNDLGEIRRRLAASGAPTNYVVPRKLEQLSVTGAARLRWNGNPVSMLCFDRGDKQMLLLFVIDRSALRGDPPPHPALAKVSRLQTASWTQGESIYLLAGPDEANFLEKYGPSPSSK